MPLARLRVSNLRCIAAAELSLHPKRVYVYGPNGAGKTTLLEAIYLLSRARSFRTREIRRLLRFGEAAFTVYGELAGNGVRRVGVSYRGAGLEKRVDGTDVAGGAALAAELAVFVVDPSVHSLVEGGPTERRKFIDWGVFHVEHRYLEAYRRYRRALGQRNAALKANAAAAELDVWTEALVEAGESVDRMRSAYARDFRAAIAPLSASIVGSPLDIDYARGWAAGTSLEQAMTASLAADRAMGVTHVGPHRADLKLSLGGVRLAERASRGQQKLAATSLVLAQAALQGEQSPDKTVLLLDDPAAELDRAALARLVRIVDALDLQVVMTALEPQQLAASADASVFHVERGEVRAL